MQFSTALTVGGETVILADEEALKGTKAWQKANSVFCPLGPAPSEAWLLLTKASLNALNSPLTADQTIVWEMECLAPDASQSVTLTMAGWRLASAERIFTGGPADDAGLFLCQFVDARFRANNDNSGPLRANLRSYANSADYLAGTTGYTWTSLVTELWTACGVLGAFPSMPSSLTAIDGVPENFFLIGLNAWRALCSVLDLLDCAVKHNPLTNTYTIVQLGASQTLAANTARLKYDSEPIRSNIDCAATVRVHFFFHRKGYGQERDTEVDSNWVYVNASDVIDVATGISGASGTKTLWDDLPWILDETETHTNAGANTTRAANRKARYVTRYTVSPAHKIFSGLLGNSVLDDGPLPGAQVRATLWRNWGDLTNPFGGTVTEYVSGPKLVTGFGPGGDGGGANFVWTDKDLVQPEREGLAPPDYGRKSYPNYPRLPNIVQVHHTSGTAGDEVAPNADGFHLGRVRRWVSNAMDTLETCWIRFVDQHDTNAGQVNGIQDDFYYGRLCGVSTSDATLLPVYLVKKGESANKLVRFRLSADLSNGGSAAANILTWNGAAYVVGAAITVYDWWAVAVGISTRGMWQGKSGMEGWCFKREVGAGQYDIVWMETYAWDLETKLNSSGMSGSTGTASSTLGDTVAFEQGVHPGAGVTLHDDQSFYPRIQKDAKVKAWRSEYEGVQAYYKILQSQQMVLYGTALLAEDTCGIDTTVTGFVGCSFSPFNLAPDAAPSAVANPFGLAGMAGDACFIVWDEPNTRWILLQVDHHAVLNLLDIRINGNYIQGKYQTQFVMYCTPAEWIDVIPLTHCSSGGS